MQKTSQIETLLREYSDLLTQFDVPQQDQVKLVMFVEELLDDDDPFNEEMNRNEVYQEFAEEVLARDIAPLKETIRRIARAPQGL